jgi:hypothetical protein
MDRKKFNQLVDEFVNASSVLLKSKSHDYASEDVLSNFKRVTAIAKQYRFDFSNLPEYALFMCCMKADRIMNLFKGNKKPKNEAIEDSFADMFNYCLLAYVCYKEQSSENSI